MSDDRHPGRSPEGAYAELYDLCKARGLELLVAVHPRGGLVMEIHQRGQPDVGPCQSVPEDSTLDAGARALLGRVGQLLA